VDEEDSIHGRTDHRDRARALGWIRDGGCLPQTRYQQRYVLQLEGEVRRPRSVGGQAASRSEDENRRLKKLLAETMLDNAMLKDSLQKKMVTPAARREAVAYLCDVHLPEAELCKLRQRAITKRWKKGETLFHKGDTCDGMHGVLSGSFVTFIEGQNGKSQSIGIYVPGSHVGMLSLIDGGIRHVTAMAREES
jgi:CRP-like cAMP-binding protein